MNVVVPIVFSIFLIGGYSYFFILFGKYLKTGIQSEFTLIAQADVSLSFLNIFHHLYNLGYSIKRRLFGYDVLCNLEYSIKNQNKLYNSDSYEFVDSKTIYFTRHGQSMSNYAFKNYYTNPFKGLRDIFTFISIELFLAFTSHTILLDPPLTLLGLEQCNLLNSFMFGKSEEFREDRDIIANSPPEEIVWYVSDLRRAQSTLILSFYDRFKQHKDKIYTDQNLTESTLNPDCISLSPNGSCIGKDVSLIVNQSQRDKINEVMENFVDNKFEFHKHIHTDILTRMNNINDRIFTNSAKNIVIVGHSRWFRIFFTLFYEPGKPNVLKESKIHNCALVKFELDRYVTKDGNHVYFIKPDSQKFIHKFIETSIKDD